jgi:sorbitol-6-phosphate 2-dehydrogenase
MSGRLPGNVTIITGAGQGIGKGIAQRFIQEGAKVLVADINPVTAEQTAAELRQSGGDAASFTVDVTKADQVDAMVEYAVKLWGRLDTMICSAGIIKAYPIMEFPEETWDAIINVNLKGTFLCARAASRVMVEQRSGSIIMINSKSGKKGGLWLAAYCASKFGGIGLIQSIALDLAPFNVRANAICPGNVFSTPMWDLLDKEYSRKLGIPPEQVRQKYLEKVPLGRECKVEDVASAAVFLASDEASYITGISLSVTGGQEMN